MKSHYLRLALAAAGLSLFAPVHAAPVMLNFKATITQQYDYVAGAYSMDNAGSQVTASMLVNVDQASPYRASISPGYAFHEWFTASGCEVAIDGACRPTADYGTAAKPLILNYSIDLLGQSYRYGDLMKSQAWAVKDQIWRQDDVANDRQAGGASKGAHVVTRTNYAPGTNQYESESHEEAESLSFYFNRNGSGLFADPSDPLGAFSLANLTGNVFLFNYFEQDCKQSNLFGRECSINPASFVYQMRIDEMSVTPAQSAADVPEPATVGLLGFGLFGLALARRKRKTVA